MVTPLRVGIVGTGYVARTRAKVFQTDPRSQLITLVGRNSERTEAQCQEFDISPSNSWEQLVNRDDLDLVVVATVNCDHAAIVQAALSAQKHVIVEYPLALEIAEAKSLIQLAQQQGRLLHVEHIELLGGLHQAIKRVLPEIGPVFHGQYSTLSAKHPAPQKWTYQHSLFGFPLVGALSRLHRWIDLFGQVETVNCHSRFWNTGGENSTSLNTDRYQACLCQAHLQFEMGPTMEIIYG
ncbi:MAG: Gfo/Idh/MocA family protein [Microcoleaceae cyanobacterium]